LLSLVLMTVVKMVMIVVIIVMMIIIMMMMVIIIMNIIIMTVIRNIGRPGYVHVCLTSDIGVQEAGRLEEDGVHHVLQVLALQCVDAIFSREE
jgi:hypothetical protein